MLRAMSWKHLQRPIDEATKWLQHRHDTFELPYELTRDQARQLHQQRLEEDRRTMALWASKCWRLPEHMETGLDEIVLQWHRARAQRHLDELLAR